MLKQALRRLQQGDSTEIQRSARRIASRIDDDRIDARATPVEQAVEWQYEPARSEGAFEGPKNVIDRCVVQSHRDRDWQCLDALDIEIDRQRCIRLPIGDRFIQIDSGPRRIG